MAVTTVGARNGSTSNMGRVGGEGRGYVQKVPGLLP